MIAKVTITNTTIIGESYSQEQEVINYELLLTTIYKGKDGKSAYEIALEHGFVGTEEEWIASNKLVYKIVDVLPEVGDNSIFYLIKTKDGYDQYVYNNGKYEYIGDTKLNLEDYYTKYQTYSQTEIDEKLGEYVKKETGRGLSSNDFSDILKSKLDSIEQEAEKNVQSDWNESDETSDAFIKHKPIIFSGDYNDLLNKPDLDADIPAERLPRASKTNQGIIQLATTDDVKNGIDDEKAITSKTLKSIIDTFQAKEISGSDNVSYSFDVSSLKTINDIKQQYAGIESITNVIVAKDGIFIRLNDENYFSIKIDNNIIKISGISDFALSDKSLKTNDKSVVGAINELLSTLILGTDTISTKIYSLRNTNDDTQLVYSLNDLTFAPVGTIVYQDKDCTIEYGKVTHNMSGTLKIDTDQSINWALNGSEDYVSDKRIATEAGVKNYVDETYSEKDWTTNSNANDYTNSGVYQFAGWRKNINDNLPITNYDEDGVDRNNIAFTLIVNAKEGYLLRNDEGNVTRNIPTMIAQTLMLGNRRGSDTKIYTRHGQTDLATNTTTWEAWREVMTSTYLGIVDSYTGDVLNGTTEIGLYTGAMVNLASNVADVFKLEVINNYVVTTQVSAATGTSVPNTVLQTITILNLDGSNNTKKRIGTYNGSGYTWGEWKEEVVGATTTKFKRGDVVYYSNYNGHPHVGVMPFEDYVKNPTNDNLTRNPIGLVADPVKRTFVFCSLFNKSFASINAMENLLCGYSSFENGAETFKRIEGLGTSFTGMNTIDEENFPAFYGLRKQSHSSDIFYLKNKTAYIPSYKEWEDIYNELWEPYTDDNGISASYLDRILAYRNGVQVSGNEYTNTVQNYSVFYYQLSTLGLAHKIDNNYEKHINTFSGNGKVQDWDNYNYNVCPVFGIYTEEEENNYPEF